MSRDDRFGIPHAAVEANAGAEGEEADRRYGGGTEHRRGQEAVMGLGGGGAGRAYCQLTGTTAPEG